MIPYEDLFFKKCKQVAAGPSALPQECAWNVHLPNTNTGKDKEAVKNGLMVYAFLKCHLPNMQQIWKV